MFCTDKAGVTGLRAATRHLILAAWALVAAAAWPTLASAHAALANATPSENSVMENAPPVVRLSFTTALEPAFSSIKVVDEKGKQVDKQNSKVTGSDATTLEVGLQSLGTGTYKVIWNIVSRDGHKVSGTYTFNIM